MKKLVLNIEKQNSRNLDNQEVQKIISMCYQCGKCSEACPISEIFTGFSPRYIASEFIIDDTRNLNIWRCLTCDRCTSICPQGVKFADFIQYCRIQAIKSCEKTGLNEAHFGYFQSLSRLMANKKIIPNRLQLIPKGVEISKPGESDILYYVGCAPLSYYEQHQFNIGVNYAQITEATLKILNTLDIKPVVLDNEKCCGHDSLWSGDLSTFIKLGEQNITSIEDAGIKTVIMSCAEGLRTFKKDYPRYIRKPKFEVISFAEFMANKINNHEFSFPYKYERKVTYHDPCRMGRQLGIFDAPREILRAIDGTELIEMKRIREEAQCCGITGWNNCNTETKYLRNIRLKEAEETGADTLVTTCPKCQMHFNCLKRETELHGFLKFNIDITDLSVFMAKALYLL